MRRICVCAGVPVEHGSIKVLCYLQVWTMGCDHSKVGWCVLDNPWFVLELQLCQRYGSANMYEQVCIHGYVPWDCWNWHGVRQYVWPNFIGMWRQGTVWSCRIKGDGMAVAGAVRYHTDAATM
jgi:hypothetical protein